MHNTYEFIATWELSSQDGRPYHHQHGVMLLFLLFRVRATTASRPTKDPLEIALFIIIFRKRSHFWGLSHARKRLKICTRTRTAKKFNILGALQINVAKWLYSTP